MKFCKICHSVLNIVTTADSLKFVCSCGEVYDSSPEDTLMATQTTANSILKFEKFMDNGYKDNTNPKISIKCPECTETTARFIRVGENEQRVFICRNNHKWN